MVDCFHSQNKLTLNSPLIHVKRPKNNGKGEDFEPLKVYLVM